MQRLQKNFLVLLIVLQVINLTCQMPTTTTAPDQDYYFGKLFQKLDEMKELNAENAALFRRQQAEQSLEITQKFQGMKDALRQLSEQNLKFSETVQKLQGKQFQTEYTFSGNVYSVRLLLESAGLNLGALLLSAIKSNDSPRVHLLLELGAPIECHNSNGSKPIHVAVQNRNARLLEILLNNKADIESKGQNQKTALHMAGYSECLECAKLLINRGARLESRDEWRRTPIIYSAMVGFNDFVELLIQKGADVNAAQNDGITGLHWAAREGQLSTVMLLVKNGADVRLRTRDGKTALDYAIAGKYGLIVEFLQNLQPN